MKKVAIILANGFEMVEALAPIDYLKRAGVSIDVIGLATQTPVSSHGITVTADIIHTRASINDYDAVILPGGMPGAKNLDESDFVRDILASVNKKGGILAAICAAPMVLGHNGYLNEKNATCYPGFESELIGAYVKDADVAIDGNVITARAMGSAIEFAEAVCRAVCNSDVAESISKQIYKPQSNAKTYEEEKNSFNISFSAFKSRYADENSDTPPDIEDTIATETKSDAVVYDYSDYRLPPYELLKEGSSIDTDSFAEEMQRDAEKLLETLEAFNVSASLRGIERGPRITKYSIYPNKGIRVNYIEKLSDDIALAMNAESVRIEAPIPGKSAIGIEIPNRNPSLVSLRELLEAPEFSSNESKTAVCIGKYVDGTNVFADISKMPHLLIAGATGMGKSVCMNTLITSILYKARPDEVKFIMIDPKQVEFAPYNGIPHLLVPVVTEPKRAAGALLWAVDEMNKRYDIIEKLGVRNIDLYNEKVAKNPELGAPMTKIIIFIDELNDLMMQARDPVENLIMIIAQKARAAGIHLVIGTQRPSVNVITGVVKANIPSRIACKVSSGIDSRTIIEQTGAEKLIGRGDMLFAPAGKATARVQGAFVSESEIEGIVDFIKNQFDEPHYNRQVIEEINRAEDKIKRIKSRTADEDEEYGERDNILYDKKFIQAIELTIKNGSAATSFLQRKLSIGYGKAAKYIDAMEDLGIISESDGSKARKVLITPQEWNDILDRFNNTED